MIRDEKLDWGFTAVLWNVVPFQVHASLRIGRSYAKRQLREGITIS